MESYKSWYAVNTEEAMILAERERKRMSVAWRIWEIATARMNNWGHASFKPDELVTLVCGSCTKSDRQAVRRGIDNLAEMGRIVARGHNPGSTELCIVVNTAIAQRRAGRARDYLCCEPTHFDYRKLPYENASVHTEDA